MKTKLIRKRMKKYIPIFYLFFLNFVVKAQEQNIYEFQPLRVFDTIKTQKEFKSIKGIVKVNNYFFFATDYWKVKHGLFLFEKKQKTWIVYDYNDFVSNFNLGKYKIYSERYISATVSAMRSGNGENYYGWFILFDLKKRTYLVLDVFSHNSDDDENHEKYVNTRECNAKIIYQNGSLKISRKCSPNGEKNYCDNCMKSGVYKISNIGLEKKSSH